MRNLKNLKPIFRKKTKEKLEFTSKIRKNGQGNSYTKEFMPGVK